MKKLQMMALLIVILFGIDYSVTQLLGFDLLYKNIQDMHMLHQIYAFIIGVCAFYSILLLKNDDE